MANTSDLTFINNQTFLLTWDLSQWALLYDLTIGKFRMQIRLPDDGTSAFSNIVYLFSSYGLRGGTITYLPSAEVLVLRAPYADMVKLTPGTYAYDLQYETDVPSVSDPGVVDLVSGTLTIVNGVSRF